MIVKRGSKYFLGEAEKHENDDPQKNDPKRPALLRAAARPALLLTEHNRVHNIGLREFSPCMWRNWHFHHLLTFTELHRKHYIIHTYIKN